jgi:hypothetical protein
VGANETVKYQAGHQEIKKCINMNAPGRIWEVRVAITGMSLLAAGVCALFGIFADWLGTLAFGVAVGAPLGLVAGYMWRVRRAPSDRPSWHSLLVEAVAVGFIAVVMAVLAVHVYREQRYIARLRTIRGEDIDYAVVSGDKLVTRVVVCQPADVAKLAAVLRDAQSDQLRKVSVRDNVSRWTIRIVLRADEDEWSIECWVRQSEPHIAGGRLVTIDGRVLANFQNTTLPGWLNSL